MRWRKGVGVLAAAAVLLGVRLPAADAAPLLQEDFEKGPARWPATCPGIRGKGWTRRSAAMRLEGPV
jgi:hypothetical protein